MERKQHTTTIVADFFADGYRVSGAYDARQRSLGDAIYDSTTSYLTIENAYVSSIRQAGEITGSYPVAIIVKDALTFVLSMDLNDTLRRDQKYGSYLGLQLVPIFLTLPFFDLQGFLRLPGRLDPRVLLSSTTERFLTVVDVTAHVTFEPDLSFQGAAALVNKSQISFLGLQSL
ncbi:MAG: hypothetical protein GYA30_02435 [Chloroflexi bacterium]|nr:hypothetical protein [Chloroflexota bacterium]HOC21864.1 hypothetical protein [Anaerolineae bacterium]HOS80784.1 hypothetical protein [Anaerolineae bacterium]HQM14733.1 hypothetical protein [Anaerolineae bacterium]